MPTAIACAPSRRRIYIARWRFQIGESVQFHGAEGTILDRRMSAYGRAMYDVWIGPKSGSRPVRTVLDKFLCERIHNCAHTYAVEHSILRHEAAG